MKKYLHILIRYALILLFAGIIFGIAFLAGIKLFFYRQEVIVPDLKNKQFHIAQIEVQKIFCHLHISDFIHSREYDAGIIIDQKIRPGTAIAQNRSIPVTVSLGPEKSLLTDFAGQVYYDVIKNLNIRGFIPGDITEVYSSVFPQGQVIAQYPSPNIEIYQNIPVDLLVSKGRKRHRFMTPDLIGKDFFEVQLVLDRLGLFIEEITYREVPELPQDIVISQLPFSGSTIYHGDYISLTLNKADALDFYRKRYIYELIPLPASFITHRISLYEDREKLNGPVWQITAEQDKIYLPVFIAGYEGESYLLYIDNKFYKKYTLK